MIGYGVIRCFVEGLRTDSLYLMPGVRVSQVLSGCLILLGVLLVGIIRRRQDIPGDVGYYTARRGLCQP